MNFVFIMTDTQNRSMVGAYGHRQVDTPNLDRLAAEGVRFDRAYTTCPLCTPARAGIFTGTHPPVNGAWGNNLPPYPTHPQPASLEADGTLGGTGENDGRSPFADNPT